ncbi:MAG: TIGR02444 family protein, partial [Alphaproteobacteria bacterium]|nr:TIGR02444 family protein [Alphaproteobacteria bacterium]
MAGRKKTSPAGSAGMQAARTANAFWRFSLRHYRRPGMAARLIELQDRHGLDVNLLLFCLFAATRGRVLERTEIARARAALRPLAASVLGPLRAARRGLGSELAGLPVAARRRLKARLLRLELTVERHCQAAICGAVPLPFRRRRDAAGARAAASLRRYAGAAIGTDLIE